MLKRTVGLAIICALWLTSAVPAQAVRLDPDSPAGVEYELPLNSKRRDLSGDDPPPAGKRSAKDDRGSDPAPLFGAGISPAGERSGSAGASGGAGQGSSGDDRRADAGSARSPQGDGSAGDGSGSEDDSALSRTAAATDSDSSSLLIPAIALAVLFGGAALGLVLRRGFGRLQGQ